MVKENHENQSSETLRNEGFNRGVHTSPWLMKILKIRSLKSTEMKVFKQLELTWLKKIMKIRALKRTETKVFIQGSTHHHG